MVSRYSTVRSGTLAWREWGLWFLPCLGCQENRTVTSWHPCGGCTVPLRRPYGELVVQKENVPTWLSGPRFDAPLHNFTPKPGDVTHRWARWQHQMHFRVTLLIMVVEIRFNSQIGVQYDEKAISKITFNIRWNLKQIWCSWYTWVSNGDIKGFENNGV